MVYEMVLTDVDMTLVDLAPCLLERMNESYVQLYRRMANKPVDGRIDPLRYLRAKREDASSMFLEHGIDQDEFWNALIPIDLATRKEYRDHITLPEDARGFLEQIARNHILVAVSNTPREILGFQAEHLGYEKILPPERTYSDAYKGVNSKPSPYMIETALKDHDVLKEDAILFGDCSNDLSAARASGIDFALVNRNGKRLKGGPPDFQGSNMLEIWEKANEMQVR